MLSVDTITLHTNLKENIILGGNYWEKFSKKYFANLSVSDLEAKNNKKCVGGFFWRLSSHTEINSPLTGDVQIGDTVQAGDLLSNKLNDILKTYNIINTINILCTQCNNVHKILSIYV